MKALLELHLIQNFAPSNLNRDDTGSPKDAYFGGVRRARVSSQSFKRAMRMDFKERGLLSPNELGQRSKRFLDELTGRLMLEESGFPEAQARYLAEGLLALNGISFIEGKPGEGEESRYKEEYPADFARSEALAFLSSGMLDELSQLLKLHKVEAEAAAEVMRKYRQSKRGASGYKGGIGKDDKKKLRSAVEKALGDISKEVSKLIDGKYAVDIALFGRMLADLPDKNADAAAQVAQALGTHAMGRREFDFYTAVDDLRPGDTAGADMLGTVEFGSATFYRYLCIDLAKLRQNLGRDDELMLRGLKALLYASVYAAPTGKQNTFAARNLPSLISTVIRQDASPRNLANAFEVAVKAREGGYVGPSIQKLATEWERQERIFGQGGRGRYVNAHDESNVEALGERQDSVEALIGSVLDDVRAVLGQLGQ
ncbi:type I-E CRISPR-associated protein Cas7/Cse4/CasC [Deinococcus aquaedulcis]|uniref:type I-E CRISPR-associated protein Cas7/Cse4/CasC n=1 Tax=Deinococcus aquaedulcis TaxID=2840455 RepID=UPI001C83E356|nr:type I-E CRISPR-associated protein Cas7/Cse4/CasC [Deinococcus aquaedulcis]